MATCKQILTADSQITDANSKRGFPVHPGHQCLELNMPQMLLPSLGFSCALGDDGVTGPYCKFDSLWTGFITLDLKSHLTSHCLRQLDMVWSYFYLLHKLSVWWTASGVTPGLFPLFSLRGQARANLGKEFPDNSISYCTAIAPYTIAYSWTVSIWWCLLFPCVYVYVVLFVCTCVWYGRLYLRLHYWRYEGNWSKTNKKATM